MWDGAKGPALEFQRTHDSTYLRSLKIGFNDLMNLHGLPMGIFLLMRICMVTAHKGTELCAIVESMFSLEEIIAITGDVQYMDALERMTFNALPAKPR